MLNGSNGISKPITEYLNENRRKYLKKDFKDWVKWLSAVNGKDIEFNWPSIFPIRSVTALRQIITDPSTLGPLCIQEN
jgi:hypothetical protein